MKETQFGEYLQILNYPMTAIRNQHGDTFFHIAIKEGDLTLLEKLFKISNDFSVENRYNEMPLDYIIHCKDLKARESILDFVEKNSLWNSNLLEKSEKKFESNTAKRNFLLTKAFDKNKILETDYNLFDLERQESAFSMLKSPVNSLDSQEWNGYKTRDLLNYVYILVKNDREAELTKLGLAIDQANEHGMTVLHYFVMLNNMPCLRRAFEWLAFPNCTNKNNETPLDVVSKIESFSTEDTLLQQQMIALLLKNKAYRCKIENKDVILKTMESYIATNKIDHDLNVAWKEFQIYDQTISLKAEYKTFISIRNIEQINKNANKEEKIGHKTSQFSP